MNDIIKTVLFIISGAIVFELLFGEVDNSFHAKRKIVERKSNLLSLQRSQKLIS